MTRASGILLPIFSLPSKYGIGSFSKEAYEFIDLLKETHQKYWQVLPLGPTGYGDSPYQSFSSFAGNAYFIDIEKLIQDGLIEGNEEELNYLDSNNDYVDYEIQYKYRRSLLKKASKKFIKNEDYERFCIENDFWLNEYCIYMVLKDKFGGDFFGFDKKYRDYDVKEIDKLILEYIEDVEEYKFIQYTFFKQWFELKEYANENDIKIIGDIPIYVSMDSAEVWLHRNELMDFIDGKPAMVAGCPPDAFTEDGQLWGNPLYDWEKMKKDNYSWWCKRFEYSLKLYDYIRVDHFRGFDSYYCIPFGSKDARKGIWKQGPGIDFFNIVKDYLSKNNLELNIIAEDLGFLTDSVKDLLKQSNFPGMKVIQFAFLNRSNDYLNYNHIQNSIVYSGTHDNQTIVGWINSMDEDEKLFLREYINVFDREITNWDIIRLTMSSSSKLAIIPFHDYLNIDNSARINEPGVLGNNWKWRYKSTQININILDGIKYYTDLYGRYSLNNEEKL